MSSIRTGGRDMSPFYIKGFMRGLLGCDCLLKVHPDDWSPELDIGGHFVDYMTGMVTALFGAPPVDEQLCLEIGSEDEQVSYHETLPPWIQYYVYGENYCEGEL